MSSPPEPQRGPAADRPTTNSHDTDSMAQEPVEWRVRLAEQMAQWRARRSTEMALRAEQAARRAAGKRFLHGRGRR